MDKDIINLRRKLSTAEDQKIALLHGIDKIKSEITNLTEELNEIQEAKRIIQEVAIQTQKQVEIKFCELFNTAQEIVFPDPYKGVLDFKYTDVTSAVNLYFEKDGVRMLPGKETGGGCIDVGAFAFRVSGLMINRCFKNKNLQKVLILDEPGKHIKGMDANKKFIEMIRLISRKTGIQIIMVSDERIPIKDIIDGADRVFEVVNTDGVSKVEQIRG